MSLKYFAGLACGLVLATQVAAQEWDSIRVASEGAYAPWNFTNAQGELDGFEIELMRELCERMNAECELVSQSWDGMIPALQAGRYDAIMAGMSITEERREVIAFSRPYATTPAIFVAPVDSELAAAELPETRVDLAEVSAEEQTLIYQLKGLVEGLTVGVQTATIHENFLREYIGDITIRTYDTHENLDLDLEAGRIDVALADQSAWQPLMESEAGEDFARVGPGFSGGVFGQGVGVGLRQEDDALKAKFDTAIQAALEDGTVSELAIKWFGFDSAATP